MLLEFIDDDSHTGRPQQILRRFHSLLQFLEQRYDGRRGLVLRRGLGQGLGFQLDLLGVHRDRLSSGALSDGLCYLA